MYRRSRFIIGFLAAALTFGGLMATIGPEHFERAWHSHHHMDHCCMYNGERMNSCDEPERFERYDRHERIQREVSPMPEMKADSVKK
jgi:hypothetical protein